MLCPYCFELSDPAPAIFGEGGEPCSPPHCIKPGCCADCPECSSWFEAIEPEEGKVEHPKATPEKEKEFESYHPAFLERLERSKKATHAIAKFEKKKKRNVVVNEIQFSPTRALAANFSDKGDMLIDGKLYEVKGLTAEFTGHKDWPFGVHFIVDGKGTCDKKKPKPLGYYIVNSSLTYFAYVSVQNTRQLWTVDKRLDRNVQKEMDFYFCPLGLVTFWALHRLSDPPEGDIPW
jgi:hypothetical protein